jgi:hypothetical protein
MAKGWQEEEGGGADGSRRGENMQSLLDERARIDASTAILGRENVKWIRSGRDRKIAVSTTTAISAYAGSATIEDWRSLWVIGPHSPIIVLD